MDKRRTNTARWIRMAAARSGDPDSPAARTQHIETDRSFKAMTPRSKA